MKKIKFITLLLLVFLSGCANESTSYNSNVSAKPIFESRNETISVANTSGGGGREEPTAQKISLEEADKSQTAPIPVERKIIRNAELNLEANSPEETQQKISAIAESKDGFVIESTQSSSDVKATTKDIVTMTLRVPAAKFNETLDEIRKTANRVIVETIKGQDVTEEFIDIEAQLKTKKALEEQFLEIMKRSNSVEDALNVQRELANVRGEIEKVEGRKRFLENQASLSTIKIQLQSPTAFSTSSSGFLYQLGQAFNTGFNAALNVILIFVTILIALLPMLILIGLPIYFLRRYLLKKKHNQKLAREIAREEIKVE